ncbi:hypothetical protein TgHK011_009376 [Trichoderma gracile]|nr:hypothetical protein TgHK011_009376 [Trichoderma gracile]
MGAEDVLMRSPKVVFDLLHLFRVAFCGVCRSTYDPTNIQGSNTYATASSRNQNEQVLSRNQNEQVLSRNQNEPFLAQFTQVDECVDSSGIAGA